jgi:hypothetical protein
MADTRTGKHRGANLLMRACTVALTTMTVIGLSLTGTAQAAPARPVPGVAIGPAAGIAGHARANNSMPCFYTFPDCMSSDPRASFEIVSVGDTSSCTFTADVDWGDGATSSQTFSGGPDGSGLAAFDHKYSMDGIYSIAWSSDVASGSCSSNSGTLQFTLFPCPASSDRTHVTLPAVHAPVVLPKKFSLSYGSLPLTFTLVSGGSSAVCAVRSDQGALPVIINIPEKSIQVADSVTTATVDFIPADDPSADVPSCDFSLLDSLVSAVSPVKISDFADTDKCLLTGHSHGSGSIIARWSIPGFAEYSPRLGFGIKVYSTPPLTYYVDLSALPGARQPSASFQEILQHVETLIHTTLIKNLPMVDKVGIVQDPPANLLVTDPLGRTVGIGSNHKLHVFPGAGYVRIGNRSIAWILEPIPGAYHVTADGKPGSQFHTDFTVLQFLGHGAKPLKTNTQWHGTLSRNGTAARMFSAKGSSLQPVIRPHESRTRVRPGQKVRFSLAGSVIPFGPVTVIWMFGDGKHAVGRAVTHRFARAGRFRPDVIVINALGTKVTVLLARIIVRR